MLQHPEPLAFAVTCPTELDYWFDTLVFTEAIDAQEQAVKWRTEVIPLYPKSPASE